MSVPAEAAVRAWINARTVDLVGPGLPLALGAYLRQQRSPEGGAYTVVWRNSEGVGSPVAEDGRIARARMQCLVFAGTEESAEAAASALRAAFETLTGMPEPCGDTGVTVLVADTTVGPFFINNPEGEQFCFQVDTDLLLTAAS